jgi:glycosyltransferase involved in cell wall biosynthesis
VNIAVVGAMTFPNRQGGMSRHIEEIYARLAARGHRVTVYAAAAPEGTEYRGMRVRVVPSSRRPSWDRLTYSASASWIASFGHHDAVHYHSFASSGFCFLPRVTRTPVVVTIHRQEWKDAKWGRVARTFLQWSEWLAVRVASALVAVSDPLADDVAQRHRSIAPIHVVSNGVDVPETANDTTVRALGLEPHHYLLAVGRVVPEKGVADVLDAFEALGGAAAASLTLAVVGGARHEDDEFVRACEARAAASGGRVRMLGIQPRAVVDELLLQAYAFVTASYHEGQPLTVLEALAAGCCVVASDIPAHHALLDGIGVLFPAGDVPALTRELEALAAEPARAATLGARGRAAVAERHELDWDTAASRTETVLSSALPGSVLPGARS